MLLEIDYEADSEVKNPQVIFGIYDFMSVGVSRFDTEIAGCLFSALPTSGRVTCQAESIHLVPVGTLSMLHFFPVELWRIIWQGLHLDIIGSDFFNTGKTFNESDSKLVKIH